MYTDEFFEQYHRKGGDMIMPVEVFYDFKSEYDEQQAELIRLKNIVEELKKYANEEISEGNKMPEEYKRYGIEDYVKGQVSAYKHILSKLEELERKLL